MPKNLASLQHLPARRCFTAAGILIHDHKILLIKHKKAGIWLAPGGHVDKHELPHQAAEREFFEETGIIVKAKSFGSLFPSLTTEYLPNPFITNLHWINQEAFKQRIQSSDQSKKITSKKWPLGCEQHYVLVYFVEATGSLDFKQNIEETDGIAWFTAKQIPALETTADIKNELLKAFEISQNQQAFT